MSTRIRFAAVCATALFAVVALTSCATGDPGAGSGAGSDLGGPDASTIADAVPAPPEGEVLGQGMVRRENDRSVLCLGAIQESYPPQCSGIPFGGASTHGIYASETANGVTWGMYAVQGTYDGEVFSSTAPPISLAAYDPMPIDDPTGGESGEGSEAELVEIQEELADILGADALVSYPENGWLHVQVVWDDGTIQDAVDAVYGERTVLIESALRPVG